jgi:type I restriction enzyme M protein
MWFFSKPGRNLIQRKENPVNSLPKDRMPRLVAELHAQFAESASLEEAIKANLRGLGYGG